MTRCRAKMCDGSPVTFDYVDHGVVPQSASLDCYLSTFIGDGFFVRVEFRPLIMGPHERGEFERAELERSGVDTATAERWDETAADLGSAAWNRYAPTIGISGPGNWVRMFPRTAAECMPLPSRTPVMDSLARRYLEGGGGMWAGLTEKRKAVDPEMRADSVRVIIKCVRDWQKTDPDRCFKVRDHDGIMSVGELGILADAAEANLSNMAKLTRMFEYGVIEPTGEMLRAGVDALLTGVGDGRPATNRVERIWHAMEKARK